MIIRKYKDVIEGVKGRKKRRRVLGFAKEVRDYLFDLNELREALKSPDINKHRIQNEVTEKSLDIVKKGESLKK